MRMEPEPDPARREAEARRGARWLGAFLLPVPVGLALWRIDGLGMGATDVVPHFLLDLLVSGYLVLLLSGPLRGRPPLPAVGAALLLALALFVGWLYLPAGLGTAGTLVAATLVVGVALRLLREHLSSVTFLRSPWMEELGLTGRKVPADAVYAPDPLTGRAARTWRRYAAFPVLAGLLLGFVALRVARPLDKRAEARAVLATGDPVEIGRATLQAATNGNAALFTRERVVWFVEPAARGEVMAQAAELFDGIQRNLDALDLQWVDLGSLGAVDGTAGRPGASEERRIHTYGGRVVAYLEDPESPPGGLAWVDPTRPYHGFYAWMAPLEVELEATPTGRFVVGISGAVDLRLRRP
ncbi:MAG TPA: hypothetical protein VLA66_03250 [Thermoanaerobaculia bacterium]|nr:hypothetical protein [Thermoanaerobaculia bacterium]